MSNDIENAKQQLSPKHCIMKMPVSSYLQGIPA